MCLKGCGGLENLFMQLTQICVVTRFVYCKAEISPDFCYKDRGAFDVCSEVPICIGLL